MSNTDGQQTLRKEAEVRERAIERWENEGGQLLLNSPKPCRSINGLNQDGFVMNRQRINPGASLLE